MTPTHKLVSIESLNKKIEHYESIGLLDNSTKAAIKAKFLDDAIEVDLSEEGIKQRAEKVFIELGASDHFSGSIIKGAELFAKDLLNTKP